MKIVIIILMFVVIGALFIVSNGNLHLSDGAEFSKFYSEYYQWWGKLASNAKAVTGYVVHFDWLPDKNVTLSKE